MPGFVSYKRVLLATKVDKEGGGQLMVLCVVSIYIIRSRAEFPSAHSSRATIRLSLYLLFTSAARGEVYLVDANSAPRAARDKAVREVSLTNS